MQADATTMAPVEEIIRFGRRVGRLDAAEAGFKEMVRRKKEKETAEPLAHAPAEPDDLFDRRHRRGIGLIAIGRRYHAIDAGVDGQRRRGSRRLLAAGRVSARSY